MLDNATTPVPAKFRETITALYRRFNALQRDEKRCFGVTLSQCMTLELLHQDGRKTVQEIAAALGLDTSTVSRTLDVLVRDGMVRRERDERGDRRRVFASLSARGRKLATKLERCGDDYCERILARVPAESRDAVHHALGVLVAALDELPETSG
jgi:DNA-binding MarR family transcriptional regulator